MVQVELAAPGRQGALVSQGGDAHGFCLYLEEGRLCFAVNRSGKVSVVRSDEPVATTVRQCAAAINKQGRVTLHADGRPIGAGKLAGLVAEHPVDGLQVGCDKGGTVGDYAAPIAFDGKISRVVNELDKAKIAP